MEQYDYLVIGAGFSGTVFARAVAEQGRSVMVVEQRPHPAGNAWDHTDAHGVLVQEYGPHIFHTSSDMVYAFLSRFTDWRLYEHRVRADVDGALVPMPVNRDTVNEVLGMSLDQQGVEQFLADLPQPVKISNSRDMAVSRVGEELYQKLFDGYTRKQWGMDASELLPEVTGRLRVRTSQDDRYFTDTYQCMPQKGFGALFERMLDHDNITVEYNRPYAAGDDRNCATTTVCSSRIDAFYDYCYGILPYRSLRFEHYHIPDSKPVQPVAVVNYPSAETEYTRVTEFRHLTGQEHSGTSLVREYACEGREPYYPVPQQQNHELYNRYAAKAVKEQNLFFLGRLGMYHYCDMDQAALAALQLADELCV